MKSLPQFGFLRLYQIVGQKAVSNEQAAANRAAGKRNRRAREATPAIFPLSAAGWWRGVNRGDYPKPVKVGRSTLWRVEDVLELVARVSKSGSEK